MPHPQPTAPSRTPNFGVRIAAACVLALAAVAAAWFLQQHNPHTVPNAPPCPSRLAGFYCPGCGSTRATHHLLNARIAEAWRFNPPLLLLGIPVGVYFAGAVLTWMWRGRAWRVTLPAWFVWPIVIGLIAWGVVRNLPLPGFDRLRPPDSGTIAAATEPQQPHEPAPTGSHP